MVSKIVLDTYGATWGNYVWPWWLGISVGVFLFFEAWGLKSNAANTLSAWVWRSLQITRNETPLQWSAVDFLTFGVWLILVVWLSFHFWFGRFT